VDEVIIGAPYSVTEEMISNLGISLVVHGSQDDVVVSQDKSSALEDPYKVAKQKGIFQVISSPSPQITTTNIIQRIIDNRLAYEARNKKKEQKELQQIQQMQQQ
jgi:ethanolamine-phosphate cytidylyltransferase